MSWCYENYLQYRSLRRARDIREQLIEILERVEVELVSNGEESIGIRRAIASGFFPNTARLNKNGSYTTLKYPHSVDVHPQSSLFSSNEERDQQELKYSRHGINPVSRPNLVLYAELVLTTKEYMRNVIEILPEWLMEVAPHYFKPEEVLSEHKVLTKPASV